MFVLFRMRCYEFPKIENGIIEDKDKAYYYNVSFSSLFSL